MKFTIDTNRVTLGDLIALESRSMVAMRNVMAKCMTDEQGQPVPFEQACELLNATPLGKINELTKQFQSSLEGMKSEAIPPSGGGL